MPTIRFPDPLLITFHVVTSIMCLDPIETYFNQSRLVEALDVFSRKRRASSPPNPCSAPTGGHAPTEQGPIVTQRGPQLAKGIEESLPVSFLEEQLKEMQLRLEQAQEQEAQAQDYKTRMIRHRRSLEEQRLSSRQELEDLPAVLRRFRLRHQEEMITLWEIAEWTQEEQIKMTDSTNILRERVEKLKEKREKWTAEHDIEKLRSENLAWERQCSQHREMALEQKRHYLQLEQSHAAYMNQRQEANKKLRERAERLEHRLSQAKKECRQGEAANHATEARLIRLKSDLVCFQQDLMLRQELEAVEERRRRCSKFLRLLGKIFILEVICGLIIFLAWSLWM